MNRFTALPPLTVFSDYTRFCTLRPFKKAVKRALTHPENEFYDGFMKLQHHERSKIIKKPLFALHKFCIMNKIFQIDLEDVSKMLSKD